MTRLLALVALLASLPAPAWAETGETDVGAADGAPGDGAPTDAASSDAAPSDASPPDGAPSDAAPSEGAALRAMAGHLVLDREEDLVHVTEVYVLVAEATVPARPGELWIALPEGARGVEVGEGEAFATPAARPGIELRGAIEAGRHALSFGFVVQAPEGEAMLAHTLPFEVEALHVVWPAGLPLSARAMGFGDTGVVEIMGRRMRVLERGRPLQAGERLAILTTGEASAMPAEARREGPGTRDPLGPLVPVTIALAALLLLGGLLLPPARRREREGPAGGERGET